MWRTTRASFFLKEALPLTEICTGLHAWYSDRFGENQTFNCQVCLLVMSTPKSVVFGFMIGIFSAIGWILYVNHLLNTAQVPQSAEHWIQIARNKAYGLCYDGCYDCIDVDSIEKACHMTTKVTVSGVTCDASKIWTWVNRYPIECLEAVGEIYKADALWWKKLWISSLYLLTVLSIPIAVLADNAMAQIHEINTRSRRPSLHNRRKNGNNSRTPLLHVTTVSILILTLATPATAYACTHYHPAHNQLFANEDNTLYGVIHGWLSNCYNLDYSCGESCTTLAIDKIGEASTSCSAISCTETRTNRGPIDFVRSAARKVQECGFRLVDIVPGVVDMRIANPRIEGKLWVKVAVNRFNGSEGVEPKLKCLYNIIDAPG
jgi:hypothetical protein